MNFRNPLTAKTQRHPVTICIGYLSKSRKDPVGDLVLASDSRISVGNNVTNDAKKIATVKFKNSCALIAKAGYRHSFARFEEIFSEKAALTEVTSYRTIASVAEDAIRDLQRELLDRHTGDAAQRLQDSYCEFIIAYFYDKKAYLYTLNLTSRIAERADRDFVSIGNGSILADFLLTSIDFNNEKGRFDAAISVIEMCKLHDSSCGGPCRMGIINDGPYHGFNPLIVDEAHLAKLSRKMNFTKKAHADLLKRFAGKFRYLSDASFWISNMPSTRRPKK